MNHLFIKIILCRIKFFEVRSYFSLNYIVYEKVLNFKFTSENLKKLKEFYFLDWKELVHEISELNKFEPKGQDNWQKYFKDLIVLRNAVPNEISDNKKTVCTVAYSNEHGLIRIYPVPPNAPMKRWNIISIPLERNKQDSRDESKELLPCTRVTQTNSK